MYLKCVEIGSQMFLPCTKMVMWGVNLTVMTISQGIVMRSPNCPPPPIPGERTSEVHPLLAAWSIQSGSGKAMGSIAFQTPRALDFLAPIATPLMSSHPPQSQPVQRVHNHLCGTLPRHWSPPSNCFPGFSKQISPLHLSLQNILHAQAPSKSSLYAILLSQKTYMSICFH